MKRTLLPLLVIAAIAVQLSSPVFAEQMVKVSAEPNAPITRAGAVAMIISANQANLPRVRWYARHMPPIALFRDVDQKAWYSPYLEVAFEQGIVVGNSSGLFRPDANLIQEEAAHLSVRLSEATKSDDGVFLTIAGAGSENHLDEVAAKAEMFGLTMPYPFAATSIIGRGAFFAMLQSAGIAHPENTEVAFIPVETTPARVVAAVVTPPVLQPIQTGTQPQQVQPQPVRQVAQVPAVPRQTTPARIPSNAMTAQVTTTPVPSSFSISMPSLGITSLTVTHPTDYSHDGLLAPLKAGVGHLFSYPGQGGKILVYGHSSGYPWDVSQYTKIFRQINKLQPGNIINISYNGQNYSYRVTRKQAVPASDTSAYQQEGREELILYTCWPPDSIKQRYLVHAEPVAQ